MRWWGVLMVVLAAMATSCSRPANVQVGQVEIIDAEYPTAEQEGLPQYVTLAAEVDNSGGAITLKECCFSLYYKWRKVAIVELTTPIKIPGRTRSRAEMRMHIAVARNSQTLPLKNALERGEMENVQVEWQAKVRQGIVSMRIEQPSGAIEEVLSAATIAEIKRLISEEK